MNENYKIAVQKIEEAAKNESTELYLSGLNLSELPETIGQLKQLESLHLSSNQFTQLPEAIGHLIQLKMLDLHNNQLTYLPETIGQLKQLQLLHLSGNQFTQLPEAIGHLKRLQLLDFHNNQLTYLPETIGQLTQLQTLYLQNNQLTQLPETIGQLTQLKTLHLSGNQLTYLPETIGQLTQLHTLYLHDNQLTQLPETIGQLKRLQALHLSDNQLTRLPETIGQLTQLHTLHLSDNQLTRLPETIGQLKQLQLLQLSGNQLTQLPEAIGHLKRLQLLYLHDNQLTQLPETIGQLKRLQLFYLHNNQLTQLPETIGQLMQLQTLYLHTNQLTQLPETIGQLTQLQLLQLQTNQLTQLPETIGQLTRLQTLHLSDNQLTQLPETIGQLTRLQLLHLSDNQLTQLPEKIGQLTQLQTLYLHTNQLTELAESLKKLKTLYRLSLNGNLQLGLPAELLGNIGELIISNDTISHKPHEILDFYFRVCENGRPLREAKLILVGRGAVGKTSLVNRLVFDRFDRDEKKTPGIKIDEWEIELDGKEEVNLNVWDFGGQEIMHTTHRFFLTERSLYLIVLNGREGGEDAEAEYWLKMIDSFGGKSPVIVVLNKISDHNFDLNRGALEQKYPNIKAFVKTDCGDETGIGELHRIIRRETDKLDELRVGFPSEWFAVKDRLSNMDENYLRFDQYQEICRNNGVENEQHQDMLAKYLNQLGIILNFKDDPRLRDTHVLNPHWVTEGIYKLLNSPFLVESKGDINLGEVSKVLPEEDYPTSMHRFIFDLMKKFYLCFSYSDDDCHYLIPELLTKEQPIFAEHFNPHQCLNFEYHYSILPEGILPRFIVRTNILSRNLPRWRSGVILEFEECRALVKADIVDKKISIWISGENAESRRRLLAVIRSDFERIHNEIKNLEVDARVPLPEYPAEAVSYNKLLVLERNNKLKLPYVINDDIIELDVRNLLNGVELSTVTAGSSKMQELERRSVRLFYSYSHRDETLRNELETHLKILERRNLISSWHDRQIEAGDDWKNEIDKNLEIADIVLLLVSADFIASDYCYEKEMKCALERHEKGETVVIPVIIRDASWNTAPFGKFQALPKNAEAVTLWSNKDSAWRSVSEGIETVAEKILTQKYRRDVISPELQSLW